MKNFEHTHITAYDNLPAPDTFPDGPEIIDTDSLRALIPGLFARLAATFTPDSVARGAAARIREIRTCLQKIYKAEKANFKLWMIRSLKADAALQAQVLEDLGGHAAMTRWEKRFEKSQKPEQTETACAVKETRGTFAKDKLGGKLPRIKTDRYGLFKLAPITRKKPSQRRAPSSFARTGCQVGAVFASPGPIGLTPEDLRSQAPSGGNFPAPDPRRIIDIWEGLHCQIILWNSRLVLADLAITIPAFREDFLPP